jgi:chaperonin GroES
MPDRESDEKIGYHRTNVQTTVRDGTITQVVSHIGPEAVPLGDASIRPLHDVIVVRRKDPEKLTAGGLHIPTGAQHESTIAEVVAVGPGKLLEDGTRRAPLVKVGDLVLLGRWLNRDEVEVGGFGRCVVVRESDIYAVVDIGAPIVASGIVSHPNGYTDQELDDNVAAHKANGCVVEPCGFCGKDTTMVSYVIGTDTPQGQAHRGPDKLAGYRVPACCARDACIDRMDSSVYIPPTADAS